MSTYKPNWALIPPRMRVPLCAYLAEGQRVGHFLTAVLSNNLCDACSRADDENILLLPNYVRFLHNYAPSAAWGSPEKVKAWIEIGGVTGSTHAFEYDYSLKDHVG